MTHNIIIDTSIALEDIEFVQQLSSNYNVFLTDIVLQELDGHKKSEGQTGYNAREFFRQLGKSNGEALTLLPDGKPLQNGDSLRLMTAGEAKVYVLVRKNYKTKNINDSKIIEVAKDYGLTLVTLDMAQKVRALSEGVEARGVRVESEKEKNREINTPIRPKILIYLTTVYFLVLMAAVAATDGNPLVFLFGFIAYFILFFIVLQISSENQMASIGSRKNDDTSDDSNSLNIINDPAYSSFSCNIYHSDDT